MKRLLTLSAFLIVGIALFAHDLVHNGVYYRITDNTNPNMPIVAVTYQGNDMQEYQGEYDGDIVIPSAFVENNKDYQVRSIDAGAFYWCRNLNSITIFNGVETIGEYAFYGCWNLAEITIPSSVKSIGLSAFALCESLSKVTINSNNLLSQDFTTDHSLRTVFDNDYVTEYIVDNNVTKIGANAFYGCTMKSVTIGSKVATIDDSAFDGCNNLATVTINSDAILSTTNYGKFGTNVTKFIIGDYATTIGSHAFKGCSNMTSVIIGKNVEAIGARAFEGCSSLTSVTIPSTVTTIGARAFDSCSKLASVTIPEGVTVIGNYTFIDCSNLTSVTIPSTVTTIGWSAFQGCSKLASVTIPEGVTDIGRNAFHACTSLTSVTIPSTVTTIGGGAFYSCSKLASVTIPEGVTTIETGTFYDCSNLTSVTIPSSVTNIKSKSFSYCTSLPSITIPEGVTSIGKNAFQNCESLSSITIPSSVTTIEEYAFQNCESLSSITIPSSVTTIEEYAFQNCTSLSSITIPNSVTTIEEYTFQNCESLSSITIPSSVTTIDEGAFYGCNLTTVIAESPSPITIDQNAFPGRDDATLFVPYGSKSSYADANYWKHFKEIIEMNCLYDDASNATFLEQFRGKTMDITLKERTLYRDGSWNTLCLPFNLSRGKIAESPLAGCTIQKLSSSEFDNGTLTLNFSTVSNITQGDPYLVKWDAAESDIVSPTFKDVYINNRTRERQTPFVTFKGSFSPVELEANDKTVLYLGDNNTLYYPSADMKIGACRAYFQLNDITAGDLTQGARIVMNMDGEVVTGIYSIDNSQLTIQNEAGAWFTLDGRKLSGKPTQKGIYIHNGKKVVIK